METEESLITQYKTLKDSLNDDIRGLQYCKPEQREAFQDRIAGIEADIRVVVKKLTTVEDKPSTAKRIAEMKMAFKDVLENLKTQIPGYGVSKNQATVIEGAVYGKALHHIFLAFDNDYGVFGTPSIYFQKDSKFDPSPLIGVLEVFAGQLDSQRIENYIDLVNFYTELKKAIINLANK